MLGPEDLGCTIRMLPQGSAIAAAISAAFQNPANKPGPPFFHGRDTSPLSPSHLAAITTKYWGAAGVKLTVAFLEQTTLELRNKVLKYANAWRDRARANVEFVHSTTDPQVRVTFAGDGYWSYLGTDIQHVGRTEPTMCLQGWHVGMPDAEWLRVVIHEFGHTLGFPHEHTRADIIADLDVELTVEYHRRFYGWSRETTLSQVLTPISERSIMGTPRADRRSVMCYMLPASITKSRKPIEGGNDLSPDDVEFAGKIYPMAAGPEPKPPVEPPPEAEEQPVVVSMDYRRKRGKVECDPTWNWSRTPAPKKGAEPVTHPIDPDPQPVPEQPDQKDYARVADDLESCVLGAEAPQGAPAPGTAQHAVGGMIGAILSLVTALRSGDFAARVAAVKALIDLLFGTTGDSIQFNRQHAVAARINWRRLIKILAGLFEDFASAP